MSSARHKRRTRTSFGKRRVIAIAVPAAVAMAVPVGVVAWPDGVAESDIVGQGAGLSGFERQEAASRGSADRSPSPESSAAPSATVTTPDPTPSETPEPTETETPEPEEADPEPTVAGQMYTTEQLNVRVEAGREADVVTVLARGTEVDITGESDGDWVEILIDGEVAWVNGDYLSEDEPAEEEEPDESDDSDDGSGGGISTAECSVSPGIESGLTPDGIRVYRAVCAQFPQIDSYGGLRSGDSGAHGSGRAVDIMVRGSLGDEIAEWVRANHQALGVSEVIWAQRIWTVQRSGEGWRPMSDRGSDTANHYDHVHVTVYGDSGTA